MQAVNAVGSRTKKAGRVPWSLRPYYYRSCEKKSMPQRRARYHRPAYVFFVGHIQRASVETAIQHGSACLAIGYTKNKLRLRLWDAIEARIRSRMASESRRGTAAAPTSGRTVGSSAGGSTTD